MITATDHVAITVRDLAGAIEFFRDLLGLSLTWRTYDHLEHAEIAFLGEGPGQIELLAPDEPPEGPVGSVGLTHLAFLVDDIEATRAELEHKGVRFTDQVKSAFDLKWIYFEGPEGVQLELIERQKA